jgi:hypothetical protein
VWLRATFYCATLVTWGSSLTRARHLAAGDRSRPVILKGRRARSRKNLQDACIAPPDLDPRPLIFAWSSAPHSPTPASRRSPGRSRLRPFGLPYRRRHDQPSRRTLFLRALGQCPRGDRLMHENAAGRGCVDASLFSPWDFLRRPLRAKGGSGSIPKMLPQAALRGTIGARLPRELARAHVARPKKSNIMVVRCRY